MVTLRFTDADYLTLLMILGYAAGARSRAEDPTPKSFTEVIDWTLSQGPPANYTYWHRKAELIAKKEAELEREKP